MVRRNEVFLVKNGLEIAMVALETFMQARGGTLMKQPEAARSVAAPKQQTARSPDKVLHHSEATGGHAVPPAPPADKVLHH
ncbi:MAG: hypothetical protein LBD24_06745 [Spirochaetaceae bacterium]|nr:hypothetical protein [Spirochaetaceae bacterium]